VIYCRRGDGNSDDKGGGVLELCGGLPTRGSSSEINPEMCLELIGGCATPLSVTQAGIMRAEDRPIQLCLFAVSERVSLINLYPVLVTVFTVLVLK